MRIAYLTSQYGRASDTFIRNEVAELRRRGHEVMTFSVRRPPPEVGSGASEQVRKEQAGTEYLLEAGVLGLFWAFLEMCVRWPGRICRAGVMAFRCGELSGIRGRVLQAMYLVEGAYLAKRLEVRGIEHLHNHIAENSATVAMLAGAIAGVPWSMTVHGPGIFYHPRKWGLGEKVKSSAFTACISEFCRSQCMVFAPFEAWGKLQVVRCGVEEIFLSDALTPPPEARRLVSVGRLCEEKGQMLLVEAAAKLRRMGVVFELILVGDGPLRGAMEKLIAREGLNGVVKITGWASSAAVKQEMLAARALVSASFAEGLPVVMMESLALGRPVVATRIAGVPELVVEGQTGWLVAAGDVEGLVVAMKEALETPAGELAAMGARGRERVMGRHRIGTEVGKLEQLIVGAGKKHLA